MKPSFNWIVPGAHGATKRVVQRASADAVFGAQHRPMARAMGMGTAEELIARPGGAFHLRSAQRQTFQPPTGTFNFVRVQGEAPRARPLLVSSKLPHAQIAAGRPVVYAGTARFDQGQMAWWSNFSGTYQPIADFRAQAGLPEDKFVPWQKLQLGGTSMQRGTFVGRVRADPPPNAVKQPSAGRSAAEQAEAKQPGPERATAMRPKTELPAAQPVFTGITARHDTDVRTVARTAAFIWVAK